MASKLLLLLLLLVGAMLCAMLSERGEWDLFANAY